MGCFSFKCIECGRGVKSSSFSGEQTHLFLLKDGKVVQQMTGEYNSYGAVFIDGTQTKKVKHDLRESVDWKDPNPDDTRERDVWHKVCDLMHDDNIKNGIAAVHVSCFKEVPNVSSVHDPNQGWGDEDDTEDYLGSTTGDGHEYPKSKPIPGYDVMKDHRLEAVNKRIWEIEQSVTDTRLMRELIDSKFNNPEVEAKLKERDEQRKQEIKTLKVEKKQLEKDLCVKKR